MGPEPGDKAANAGILAGLAVTDTDSEKSGRAFLLEPGFPGFMVAEDAKKFAFPQSAHLPEDNLSSKKNIRAS
jgi:hypothetical protein